MRKLIIICNNNVWFYVLMISSFLLFLEENWRGRGTHNANFKEMVSHAQDSSGWEPPVSGVYHSNCEPLDYDKSF